MSRILVMSPHMDDEAIGCGGSILKHVELGNEVIIAYLEYDAQEGLALRVQEACAANKFMQTTYHFLGLKEMTSPAEIEERVVKFLRETHPDYVYIPHGQEADYDHRQSHQILMPAMWKANGNYYSNIPGICEIKGVFQYEVHTPLQDPTYFEDISKFAEGKKRAIDYYNTQISRVNYSEGILALNKYRGLFSGTGSFCEAFKLKSFRNLFENGRISCNTRAR